MLGAQAQRDDRKRVQLAAGLQVLILLKAAQCIGRIPIPCAAGLSVQITLLGERFLNLSVAVRRGRRLSRAPCRARRARRSLLHRVRHVRVGRSRRWFALGAPRRRRSLLSGRRRGFGVRGFLLLGSSCQQAGRAGQPGSQYRDGFSQMQSFSMLQHAMGGWAENRPGTADPIRRGHFGAGHGRPPHHPV